MVICAVITGVVLGGGRNQGVCDNGIIMIIFVVYGSWGNASIKL